MHITGLNGMPRRTFTYDAGEGFTTTNFISTIGAFLMGISILFMFWNLVKTHWENKKVGPDPWDGRTLEWTVDSPSPENTFEPMPVVDDLNPLAKAKNENRKMETTNEHRSSPIARDSIIPFLISMTLGVFGICMTYEWYIAAFVVGAVVFAFFILRALTDEKNDYYGKDEGGAS